MNHRYMILAVALFLSLAGLANGQSHPMGQNLADIKFGPVPGLPTCAPGAVQSGDPTKGPSILIGKLAAGCAIPWHWHTPGEHLMMVSGTAKIETKDGKPFTLRAAGSMRGML